MYRESNSENANSKIPEVPPLGRCRARVVLSNRRPRFNYGPSCSALEVESTLGCAVGHSSQVTAIIEIKDEEFQTLNSHARAGKVKRELSRRYLCPM